MKCRRMNTAVVIFGLALVFCCQCAWAAMPAYLQVEGDEQGTIEGSCDLEGREGNIVVYGFGHNVAVPIDSTSGLPTGQRGHSPLKILKQTDKSSPKLYQALCRGERLKTVLLKFYQIDPGSRQEVVYFTILLENALISSISPSFPASFVPQNEAYFHMETVTFYYQRITWRWLGENMEFSDTWTSRQ